MVAKSQIKEQLNIKSNKTKTTLCFKKLADKKYLFILILYITRQYLEKKSLIKLNFYLMNFFIWLLFQIFKIIILFLLIFSWCWMLQIDDSFRCMKLISLVIESLFYQQDEFVVNILLRSSDQNSNYINYCLHVRPWIQ